MARVTVIDVQIGDVDEIISENVVRFSKEARDALAKAVHTQKKIRDTKEKKRVERQETSEKITGIMKEIYNKLEQAIPFGVPVAEISEMAKDNIKTQSALTLRIKNMLRYDNHKYRLVKKKSNKILKYYLEPFSIENKED